MYSLNYKKLPKKLIDVEMKNYELMEQLSISRGAFYKTKNSENVTMDIPVRICSVLDCDISEVVECVGSGG